MNSYRDQLLTVEDAASLNSSSEISLGALLKGKREEMGLSHDQIAQTTKIRPHILQALEEENWEALPSSAFVKGFIRSYAHSLGLDENAVADAYLKISRGVETPPKTERKPARRKKGKVLYIFSAFILLAVLFFLFTYGEQLWNEISKTAGKAVTEVPTDSQPKEIESTSKDEKIIVAGDQTTERVEPSVSSEDSVPQNISDAGTPETRVEPPGGSDVMPVKETSTSGAASSSKTAPASETTPASEAALPPDETAAVVEETIQTTTVSDPVPSDSSNVPPKTGLVLKANVKERTWIRVFVDNMEPKDYVFRPGSKPQWTAEKGFELLIGNAGGIELGFEGAPMKAPGKKGQVVRLSIPEGFERSKTN